MAYSAVRFAAHAVGGKAQALLRKEAPVSATCQIPDIREKYARLGLDPRRGVFLEVGGYDGHSFSNTSFLADQGWRGVYVEPVPKFCRRIKSRHVFNNVSVENVAIAEKRGRVAFHVMGSLSTASEAAVGAYRAAPWATGKVARARVIEAETDRLDAVFTRNDIPEAFDLMIIDVEGAEEVIVRALLESGWRPRVLVVELCDRHPGSQGHDETRRSHAAVRARILADGYHSVHEDAVNTIFSRERIC